MFPFTSMDFWDTPLEARDSDHFTVIDASQGTVNDAHARFALNHSSLPRGVKLEQGWRGGSGSLFQLWLTSDAENGFGRMFSTHNRIEIGKTLDWLIENKDSGFRDLIDRLSSLDFTDEEVGRQLDQIHGDLAPNAFFLAFKESWRHTFSRLASISPYSSPLDYDRSQSRAWGEFIGRREKTDHDGNAHGSTIERYGVVAGADYQLFPRSVTGITFQYTNPRLRQETGTVKAHDYEFGVYDMTRLTDNLDLKAYFGYSHQRYDFSRTVSLPASPSGSYGAFYEQLNGRSSGHTISSSIELVRPIQWLHNLRLLPLAAGDFEKAWIGGYQESSGRTSLVYDKATMERVMFRFGLDSEFTFQSGLYLKPKAQYAAQLND